MTHTLIVLCHPNPNSFTADWANKSAHICRELGHIVMWSDLHKMGFDPVEKAAHYGADHSDAEFDPLKAQEASSKNGSLPRDVAQEVGKIKKADLIIFHFPIWWFAPPAMLKGWCDRVLANGEMHDVDNRFDDGLFRGKKVLFCTSTGSRASESSYNGKEGDIEMLLWPLAYTLRYLGFTVLKPEIIHGVHSYNEGKNEKTLETRLHAALNAHPHCIANLNARAEIPFNLDTEFDDNGKLRVDAKSHTQFIRHQK